LNYLTPPAAKTIGGARKTFADFDKQGHDRQEGFEMIEAVIVNSPARRLRNRTWIIQSDAPRRLAAHIRMSPRKLRG
jgi:hypothetical protein